MPAQHAALHGVKKGGAAAVTTTFAGKIWPVLRKFQIGPAKATAMVRNVLSMTHWQDLAVLLALAYGSIPLAKYTYERLPEEKRSVDFTKRRRYLLTEMVSHLAKVALSIYTVDVLCVALSTIGFSFPTKWDIPSLYAKSAYTIYALKRFLVFKTLALCKFWRVRPDNMGRLELLDRLLNGLCVTLVSLLLFDWLSIQFGMAMKGLFAFGSVGTLAFTLASQGLVSQLLSGFFLTASNKVYPGDVVLFGDGTQGLVVKLGWMDTVLRSGDNTITSVPNSLLASQKVSNLSRVKMSQVTQTLRFHYDDADEIPALLETIRSEIKTNCNRLITDGSRPFRVFWTNYNEDHLEVMVDTHHYIPPIGDAYWFNRQKTLEAINRAVKKHGLNFAQLYSFVPTGQEPVWRVVPKPEMTKNKGRLPVSSSSASLTTEANVDVTNSANGVPSNPGNAAQG